MPIYAYRCSSCGHAKDVLRKMSDPALTVCPACGAPTFVKQVTAAGFQLKGSGWYVTDFRGGNAARPEAEGGAKDDAPAASKGDASTASKDGASSASRDAAPTASQDARVEDGKAGHDGSTKRDAAKGDKKPEPSRGAGPAASPAAGGSTRLPASPAPVAAPPAPSTGAK